MIRQTMTSRLRHSVLLVFGANDVRCRSVTGHLLG